MSCAICLEDLKDARKTRCGHIFCRNCICGWVNEEDYYGHKKNLVRYVEIILECYLE